MGWAEAHYELNRLSKGGKWVEMADVIDNTMLEHFAIIGEPHELAGIISDRFGALADRVQFFGSNGTSAILAICDPSRRRNLISSAAKFLNDVVNVVNVVSFHASLERVGAIGSVGRALPWHGRGQGFKFPLAPLKARAITPKPF